jgi:single-stranded DNA-binding protein
VSLNRVELIGGILGEVKGGVSPSGVWSAAWTMAIPSTRYDRASRTDVVQTDYVSVLAYEAAAQAMIDAGYRPGDQVHVLGKLVQVEVDKANGKTERKTRVVAFTVAEVRRIPRPDNPPPPSDEPEF